MVKEDGAVLACIARAASVLIIPKLDRIAGRFVSLYEGP